MLYIVVFNGDTRLTAHEIDTVFAVFDDIIEDVTDRKNRVGISDNGFIVGVVEAEFTIVCLLILAFSRWSATPTWAFRLIVDRVKSNKRRVIFFLIN